MRVIVVSDTHGKASRFEQVVQMHFDADVFIHLGDGEYDFNKVQNRYPDKKMFFVSGNCDFASNKPIYDLQKIGGKTFFFTHGAHDDVKYSDEMLMYKATVRNADVLLYGHSHIPVNKYVDSKLYVMNPGSLGSPRNSLYGTYGIIDIIDGKISMNIAELH